MAQRFKERDLNWHQGGIVYQVFVDRFAPSLKDKSSLYPSPKVLQSWDTLPKAGKRVKDVPHYQHELDFWGGDLPSLTSKLPYLHSLGVTILYLNPIFQAFSNHKYDTVDYLTIDEAYGSMDDLKHLIHSAHALDMKVVLDGVFNHMSFNSPIFQEALHDEKSPYREWFVFGSIYRHGYRAWHHAASLPELNLDHPKVQAYILDKVVTFYLSLGIDGWRLDTAIELGFTYLSLLKRNAKQEKKDALIIGEINNYPDQWFSYVDGVMQLVMRDLIILTMKQEITGNVANTMIQRYIEESGIDPLLQSWMLLENHDTARIRHDLPDFNTYACAKYLSLTLPGTYHLYQGEELGLKAESDPYNRQAFPWEQATLDNPYFKFHHDLIKLRKTHRALRIGDYKYIISASIISFLRFTDILEETLIILVNPSFEPKTETLMIPDFKLRGHLSFYDLISGEKVVESFGIFITLVIPACTTYILKPDVRPVDGYSPTKYFE
jgi:cyclomaltodextrinase / maltogenic alpha-amylase / neopullulanase